MPTPVSVTRLLPDMLAGPFFTLSVTGRFELAVGAVTANGAFPYDLPPIAPNTPSVCDAVVTAKLVVTSVAALKFSFPTWFAARTTVPTPVTVTMFPLTVAGPLFTLRTTGKPLVEAGWLITNGASPKNLPINSSISSMA